MFNIDFSAYNVVSIKTGVEAPNMNGIMERFFNNVRREALGIFLLIGRSQIERSWRNTLPSTTASDHIRGFNNKSRILVNPRKIGGAVCRSAVLGGLHNHYYRQAA
jgi:hypothetical protein